MQIPTNLFDVDLKTAFFVSGGGALLGGILVLSMTLPKTGRCNASLEAQAHSLRCIVNPLKGIQVPERELDDQAKNEDLSSGVQQAGLNDRFSMAWTTQMTAGRWWCAIALTMYSMAMFLFTAANDGPKSTAAVVALVLTDWSVLAFGAGMLMLQNREVDLGLLILMGTAIFFGFFWAATQGEVHVNAMFIGTSFTLSAWWVMSHSRQILRPTSFTEQLFAFSLVVFCLSWLPRMYWLASLSGSIPDHHLHAPEHAAALFAIFYGLLPLYLSMLVMSVVNDSMARQIKRMLYADYLTNALNRQAMPEVLGRLWEKACHQRQLLCLVMVDIDRFRNVIEYKGYQVGDKMLRAISQRILANLPSPMSKLFRFHSETFVVAMICDCVSDACAYALSLRKILENEGYEIDGQTMHTSVSLGITEYNDGPIELGLPLATDRGLSALRKAKSSGHQRMQVNLKDEAALV